MTDAPPLPLPRSIGRTFPRFLRFIVATRRALQLVLGIGINLLGVTTIRLSSLLPSLAVIVPLSLF